MRHLFILTLTSLFIICSTSLSYADQNLNIMGIELGCKKHTAMLKMSEGRSNQNVRVVKQNIKNNFGEPELFEFGLEAFSRDEGRNYTESSRFRAILAPSGEVVGLSRSQRFNDRCELPSLTRVRRSLIKQFGPPTVMRWDRDSRTMVFAWVKNPIPGTIDKGCIASELEACCKRDCWNDITDLTATKCCTDKFDEFLLVKATPAENAHHVSRIDYTLASTQRINASIAYLYSILNRKMTATND